MHSTVHITGNHWLNEIIPRLLENSLEADQHLITDLVMEYGDIEAIKQRPSPRLMTSHLPYRNVPKKHLADGGKFIHIIRNPKDVALSAFQFERPITYFESFFILIFNSKAFITSCYNIRVCCWKICLSSELPFYL